MNVNLQTRDSRFKSETLKMYQSCCSIKILLPTIWNSLALCFHGSYVTSMSKKKEQLLNFPEWEESRKKTNYWKQNDARTWFDSTMVWKRQKWLSWEWKRTMCWIHSHWRRCSKFDLLICSDVTEKQHNTQRFGQTTVSMLFLWQVGSQQLMLAALDDTQKMDIL